jgi:hypothetical protein
MATQPAKVYASGEEMIAGVAKETGVKPEDVRKVLHASFASTKDFILGEIARAHAEAEKGKGKGLSDKDLEQVSGGILSQKLYATPGITLYRQYFTNNYALEKIGSLGL